MDFLNCLSLLRELSKKEIIKKDKDVRNNILVYRSGNENFPEGWYSENIVTVASELVNDSEGVNYLISKLNKVNWKEKKYASVYKRYF